MDVASSFAVSIAPPPFQKEVEEARRDTQNRVSIPKTQESAASNAQSRLADERGNTEGENSLLNAQQKGISDAKDSIDADERRKKRQSRQNQDEQDEHKDEEKDEKHQSQNQSSKRDDHALNSALLDEDENAEYKGEHYQEDQHPPFRDGHIEFDDSPEARRYPRPGIFNPVTGCFEIPAYRNIRRRNILLTFKEKNVRFLDSFSDKHTAVGLINFALTRRYGSIIPHPPMGQVVEKLA